MTKGRILGQTASFIGVLILVFCLTACNFPGFKGSRSGTLELGEQQLVDVPGGLMMVDDGSGSGHPVLLYNYQIQSRLVTAEEYLSYASGLDEAAQAEFSEIPVGEEALFPAGVNWYQAQGYCEALGGRLPTEAELVKLTQTEPECPGADYAVSPLGGFGEWVYDWDDPDYYSQSLVTNPFGAPYGDLKVVLGLDLGQLEDVLNKWTLKDKQVMVTFKSSENYYKIEIGADKLKVESSDGELKFWDAADVSDVTPRLGMLPDESNPLVGFRCVTQGQSLSYAPFCQTSYEANCSPSGEGLQLLPAVSLQGTVNPNLEITAASCPENGQVRITIQHELPSTDGLEVKGQQGDCDCQEYDDYPGKLFCSCASPGSGNYLNVDICQGEEGTPISLEEYCPPGYIYDVESGTCVSAPQTPAPSYSVNTSFSGDALGCPASEDLPALRGGGTGSVDLQDLDLVEPIGNDTPDLPDSTLAGRGDGSGMCPYGYTFNSDTGCCGPLSEENYGCGEDQYFDAGLKRCLYISQEGCGPCQAYDAERGCVSSDMISQRCNVDAEDMPRDEYGRPPEGSQDCGEGSTLDPATGRCVQSWDGCPLGYYLDPETKTCLPLSGPAGPCALGSSYQPVLGCCVPGPDQEGSECPEGREYKDGNCGQGEDGCPLGYQYDTETEICQLDLTAAVPCPEGSFFDPYTGFCLQLGGDARECGYFVLDLEEAEAYESSAVTGGPLADPIGGETGSLLDGVCLVSTGDKLIDAGRGVCRRSSGSGEEELYFTVEIQEGRLASITRVTPDEIDPATAQPPTDQGLCPGYYVFSEGACLPQTCLNLEIGVPTCTTAPSGESSGGSTNKCAGKDPVACTATAGCHYEFNKSKCVPD